MEFGKKKTACLDAIGKAKDACETNCYSPGPIGPAGPAGATGMTGTTGEGFVCVYNAELEYYSIMAGDAPYANPNGPWEVGHTGNLNDLATAFKPYNISGPSLHDEELHCFFAPSLTTAGDIIPTFCQNVGPVTVNNYIQPGQMALYPYKGAYKYSILRFYTPKPAVYEISASFLAGDTGNTTAYIYVNGHLEQELGPSPTSYVFTARLLSQSYVDFVITSTDGNYVFGGTPFDVTIKDVRCIGPKG